MDFGIKKIVTVKDMKSRDDDNLFWKDKTPQERIDALEFLRQQYIEFTNAPQRLQRVLTIVKRRKG